MPRIIATVEHQHYLLESAEDAGALLGILGRAKKLEYNWKAKGNEPSYVYVDGKPGIIGSEAGPQVNIETVAWEKVGYKPEPEPEKTPETAPVAVAEAPPAEAPF